MLFEVLVATFVACAGGGALSVAVVVRRLRRANQLAPNRPSHAPLRWQWSWRRPAQLHRRLQRACQLAASAAGYRGPGSGSAAAPARRFRRRAAEPRSPLVGVAEGLLTHAVALDSELVMADHLAPRWRRARVAGLEAEVRRVEAAAERLSRLSVAWEEHLRASVTEASALRPGRSPSPVTDLDSRLEAMEAALDDLAAASGQDTPGEVTAAAIRPPVATFLSTGPGTPAPAPNRRSPRR